MLRFFCILVFLLSANINFALAEKNLTKNICKCEKNLADLVEKLIPAVVNVSTSQKSIKRFASKRNFPFGSPFEEFNEMLEQFGFTPPSDENFEEEKTDEKLIGLGSGFVIDPEGYIITNYHVIKDVEKIVVKFQDETEHQAKIIGSDPRTDIALLKIKTNQKLPFVKLGDSEKARVGEDVFAIGSPFGLGGTVTSGIISARSRDIIESDSLVDNFIQTDAAINSGNSGGPMFNLQGEVIGVSTALISPSGGNVGIGFAVPSSVVKHVTDQLKASGKVTRGWIGVGIQNVTKEIAESLGLEKGKGALVGSVNENGPAAIGGLQIGDIIVKFNNEEISTSKKLSRIVSQTKIGQKIPVEVIRKGHKKKIYIVIEKFDNIKTAFKKDSSEEIDIIAKNYGIQLQSIDPETRAKFNLPKKVSGLLITKINKMGLWPKHGLIPGHIIIAADQKNITTVKELKVILEKVKKTGRKKILLHIYRSGETLFVPLPIK